MKVTVPSMVVSYDLDLPNGLKNEQNITYSNLHTGH